MDRPRRTVRKEAAASAVRIALANQGWSVDFFSAADERMDACIDALGAALARRHPDMADRYAELLAADG